CFQCDARRLALSECRSLDNRLGRGAWSPQLCARQLSTTEDTEDTEEQSRTERLEPPCPPCPPWWRAPDHFTSFSAIAPGGSGSELGSSSPFTGGRSWNMKSHFHRSDGFDACSQWRASSGRLNASAVKLPSAGASGLLAPLSARMCAAVV